MTTRHPLALQHCDHCGAWWALRPYACGACGNTTLSWRQAAGAGEVIARSEVHRAPDAQWRAHTPYVLVLVRLREQVTLMGHADAAVVVGQHVQAHVIDIDGRQLLKFVASHPP